MTMRFLRGVVCLLRGRHENPGLYWDEGGSWKSHFTCAQCGRVVRIVPIIGG